MILNSEHQNEWPEVNIDNIFLNELFSEDGNILYPIYNLLLSNFSCNKSYNAYLLLYRQVFKIKQKIKLKNKIGIL